MVEIGAGESGQLLGPIHDFETATEAYIVAGAYDIIAEVNTDAVYEVSKTASSCVQGLEGVAGTKAYISLDD